MKVMVIEIKPYHSKNALIKLNHTSKISQITSENLMHRKFSQQWHSLAVKKLSALLREITSEHDDAFYCFNCLCLFRTKTKLTNQICIKKYVKIKIFAVF